MEIRRLGEAGPELSAIGLGSWLTFEGRGGRERAEAVTRAAFEAGVTFFDTANSYGRGAAERAWGEVLAGYPRDSFVLATKVYFPMGPEDLSYWPGRDVIWTVTEHAGQRMLYGVPR